MSEPKTFPEAVQDLRAAFWAVYEPPLLKLLDWLNALAARFSRS